MNRRILLGAGLSAVLCALLARPLFSGDDGAGQVPDWMKTGPEHEKLAKRAGSYDVAGKFYAQPGQPPTETKGSAEFKVILDGKFLQQTYTGEMMGMKYTGMGIEGYDRTAKKWTFYWCDSMSTTPMYGVGDSKDGGKTVENRLEMTDPDSGKTMKIRNVTTEKSADEFTFQMYGEQEGKEALMFELAYTRKK